jgi:hypothetical protein
MYGDNGVVIDIDSIEGAVREADVIVVGFEFWPERLLIDLRPDTRHDTPPLIEIVDPLAGVQERTIWLNARRPGIEPPEQFLFFTWPHSVAFLGASPLPGGVTRRIQGDQGIDVSEAVADVLEELARIEQQETLAALRGGEGYETVWSASAP